MTLDTPGAAQMTIRPLAPDDLPLVVAIDAALEGRSRRAYVERRLASALREPALHAQFAVCDEGGLAGYMLARVLEGEFGRSERGLRLEMVGMRTGARRLGGGRQLFEALSQWAVRRQVIRVPHGRPLARRRDAAVAVGGGFRARARPDPGHGRGSASPPGRGHHAAAGRGPGARGELRVARSQ